MPAVAVALALGSALLHAAWNLLARGKNAEATFLRIPLVIGLVGLGPALLFEFTPARFPAAVWGYLLIAGAFQGVYYFGLTRGYRSGNFSVVYPLARALPVLLLGFADTALGRPPTLLGGLGLLLVSAACVVTPLESLRGFSFDRYLNRTTLWVVVTAVGTAGYTVVDDAAAALVTPGANSALRYGVYEAALTFVAYWALLRALGIPVQNPGTGRGWRWPLLIGAFAFGSYWLMLWAYQLSALASYTVAVRQFSIVVGVAAGVYLFREPAARLRIGAAVLIVAGIALISFAG